MTDPLAIYIHWPFCASKCPYCDFNSQVAEAIDQGRWRAAYLREIDRYASETKGRVVASIFFGGGTPSLMDPATVAAVIAHVGDRWTLAADAEITAEANPGSAEAALFADFRAAGVNRLSLGVQSLDDRALAFLGRRHDAAEALAAIAIAAKQFPRFSFDLIYALPGQAPAAWRAELEAAAALAGEHISAYQLTIEPGTDFHRQRVPTAADDAAAAMYAITGEILDRAGLPLYEISNHARPGAESRHNLAYWRGGDYLGIGPGAHGRLSGPSGPGGPGAIEAIQEIRAPDAWLAAAEGGGASHQRRTLSRRERAAELLMMGLRLAQGVAAGEFEARAGMALADCLDAGAVERLAAAGFVVLDEAGLRVTPGGRIMLDSLLARLIA